MDRHLLRQKVCQKISVIKTNTFDDIKRNFILAFLFTFCLEDNKNTSIFVTQVLTFSDELFDVINADPFLTL